MREVQCKQLVWGAHSAECPDCKSKLLITGAPQKVTCPCGAEWFATWWRYGDPVIRTANVI